MNDKTVIDGKKEYEILHELHQTLAKNMVTLNMMKAIVEKSAATQGFYETVIVKLLLYFGKEQFINTRTFTIPANYFKKTDEEFIRNESLHIEFKEGALTIHRQDSTNGGKNEKE